MLWIRSLRKPSKASSTGSEYSRERAFPLPTKDEIPAGKHEAVGAIKTNAWAAGDGKATEPAR